MTGSPITALQRDSVSEQCSPALALLTTAGEHQQNRPGCNAGTRASSADKQYGGLSAGQACNVRVRARGAREHWLHVQENA